MGRSPGPKAALSESTVSRICQAIGEEFDAWKHRDLQGIELEHLFVDGSHFRMHPGAPAEPVLAAWGITSQGSPVLVGLAPGAHEGHDPWAGFLGELVERGLRSPLLVITDGAPGLIGAVEVVFAHSLRQRCLIHRARNLLAKVPAHAQDQVKAAFWEISTTSTPSPASRPSPRPDSARAPSPTATASATRSGRRLTDTLPELTCFLRFPREHWPRIRHTNLIERTFGETRRRVKVIGRLPGERSCLSLVWAVLDRASRGWRGVVMTPAGVRLLQELRRQLHSPSRLEEGWSSSLPLLPRKIRDQEPASARFSTIGGTPPWAVLLQPSHSVTALITTLVLFPLGVGAYWTIRSPRRSQSARG